jgi:GT2 family glycosyltransferase
MELAILIPTYNSARHLRECLTSIDEHLRGIDYEVCVVDNASDDDTVAIGRSAGPRVHVVANPKNVGFSVAINIGLRQTSARYVMWLNPDAKISGGDVRTLLDHFAANPSAGIIGPKLLNPDGTTQLSCRAFPSYSTALFNGSSILTRLFPRNRFSTRYLYAEWDHETVRKVDWVSGACLLHRRELIDANGELDEQFFMYIEDVDFCLRATKAGWAVVYHPGLSLVHHIAGSSQRVRFWMVLELHRSSWRYYAKHFPRHPVRDAIAIAAVVTRCAVMLLRTALRLTGRRH